MVLTGPLATFSTEPLWLCKNVKERQISLKNDKNHEKVHISAGFWGVLNRN